MLSALGVILPILILLGLLAKLLESKGEVARRIKIVLGSLVVLAVSAIMLEIGGPGLLLGVAAVIGVVWWIAAGAR